MKSSKEIMNEASQLFAKLGQNVVIRDNLELEASMLKAQLREMEAEFQSALKAEQDAAAAAPDSAPALDASAAPEASSDATGTP